MKTAGLTLKTQNSKLKTQSSTLKAILFLSFLSLLTIGYSLLAAPVLAQEIPTLGGVAVNIAVADSDVRAGDIISVTKEGFRRATQDFDVSMFGVVVSAPILSVQARSATTVAVVSSGETQVRVSTASGNIEVGDLITSSTLPGVGQKATRSGYVIGKALQSYSDASAPGLIAILAGPSFSSGARGFGATATPLVDIITNPENSRYVLAALLAIAIVLGATVAFIRLVTTGVTAIGRNPLARGIIYRSMVIAGSVIASIAIAGAAGVIAIMTLGG